MGNLHLIKEYGQPGAATMVYHKVSGSNERAPWNADGSIRPKWAMQIREVAEAAERNNQDLLLHCFNLLWFRETATRGRGTGLENTRWYRGSVQASLDYFTSDKGIELQVKAILKAIEICLSVGIKPRIGLGWESHIKPAMVIAPWFRKVKAVIKKEYPQIKVYLHSFKKAHFVNAKPDGVITEGRPIAEARKRKNGLGDTEVRSWLKLNSNPSGWSPGKPEKFDYDTDAVISNLKYSMCEDIAKNGSTGHAFARWTEKKRLQRDLGANFDLSDYDANRVKKELLDFYGKLAKFVQGKELVTMEQMVAAGLCPKIKDDPPVDDNVDPEPDDNDEEIEEDFEDQITEEVNVDNKQHARFIDKVESFLRKIGSKIKKYWYISVPVFLLILGLLFAFNWPAAVALLAGLVVGVLMVA